MTVDELNAKMESGFEAVRKDMDERVAAVRQDMVAGFAAVRKDMALRTDMEAGFSSLRAEIKAEGETTRRHFDVMVEKMKEVVKVVADGTARNAERLDDHERRLTALERPAGPSRRPR